MVAGTGDRADHDSWNEDEPVSGVRIDASPGKPDFFDASPGKPDCSSS